jgi:hypothetical protein
MAVLDKQPSPTSSRGPSDPIAQPDLVALPRNRILEWRDPGLGSGDPGDARPAPL